MFCATRAVLGKDWHAGARVIFCWVARLARSLGESPLQTWASLKSFVPREAPPLEAPAGN